MPEQIHPNPPNGSGDGGSKSSSKAPMPVQAQGTTFDSSTGVPAPADALLSGLLMTAEDCAQLFSGQEGWDAMDLYFINRCDPSKRLLIKSEHYTEDGITFTWRTEGDANTSGSPSDEYYMVKKAMVDIEMTIRNGLNVPDIKSMLMTGEVEDTGSQRVHTTTRSNTIRRRPPSYVLIAVPEGEPPAPDVSGGYMFPNVTLDYESGFALKHNATDYQESQVKFIAKFTKGKDGVLSKVFLPK